METMLGIRQGSVIDLDYFKTLIEQNENKQSYLEQIALKQ